MRHLLEQIDSWALETLQVPIPGFDPLHLVAGIAATLAVIPILHWASKRSPVLGFSTWCRNIHIITCLTIGACAMIPFDYCLNPPFSSIIEVPKGAQIVSSYGITGLPTGTRITFPTRPHIPKHWYARRGLASLINTDTGARDLILEKQAPPNSGICTFENNQHERHGLILSEGGGPNSGDYGIQMQYLKLTDGAWRIARTRTHSRNTLDDWFLARYLSAFAILSLIPISILAAWITALRRPENKQNSPVPSRVVCASTASGLCMILSTASIVVILQLVLPSITANQQTPFPWSELLAYMATASTLPLLILAAAYALYRFCRRQGLPATTDMETPVIRDETAS
jgi:hypothetical protein